MRVDDSNVGILTRGLLVSLGILLVIGALLFFRLRKTNPQVAQVSPTPEYSGPPIEIITPTPIPTQTLLPEIQSSNNANNNGSTNQTGNSTSNTTKGGLSHKHASNSNDQGDEEVVTITTITTTTTTTTEEVPEGSATSASSSSASSN